MGQSPFILGGGVIWGFPPPHTHTQGVIEAPFIFTGGVI